MKTPQESNTLKKTTFKKKLSKFAKKLLKSLKKEILSKNINDLKKLSNDKKISFFIRSNSAPCVRPSSLQIEELKFDSKGFNNESKSKLKNNIRNQKIDDLQYETMKNETLALSPNLPLSSLRKNTNDLYIYQGERKINFLKIIFFF